MNKILACMAATGLICCAALSSASSFSFDGKGDRDVKVNESKDCWGIGHGVGTISCDDKGDKPIAICNSLPDCNPIKDCKPKPICNPVPVCNPLPECKPPKEKDRDFLSNCPPVKVNCDGGETKTIDCGKTRKKGDCGDIDIPTDKGHCQSVPEPASCLGLILGVGGIIARKRRKVI